MKPFNAWFYRGREHKTTNLSFLKLGKTEYFRSQRKENSPTFHKLTKAINERDRVWTNANLRSDVFTALVVVVYFFILFYFLFIYIKKISRRGCLSYLIYYEKGQYLAWVNNVHYYSFKIFLRFWLAKIPHIIHHNQLLLTKFERILRYVKNNVNCAA